MGGFNLPAAQGSPGSQGLDWLKENLSPDLKLRSGLAALEPHGVGATWWGSLDLTLEKEIEDEIHTNLEHFVEDLSIKKGVKMTVMHQTAFLGLLGLLKLLVQRPRFLEKINAKNSEGQTPLHLASLVGHKDIVLFLNAQETLRGDVEDNSEQTAFEIASQVEWPDIVKVLSQRQDVKDYLSKRRADRTMYGDGTNAILVGAALIASITFAGWLQPPLGYQKYYQYPRNATMADAPQGDFQQYMAISEHTSVKVFCITNALSFYFAIGAILAGAGAMVPRRHLHELAEVKRKRGAVYLAGFAFSWAVVFVVMAFTAAGFASLPPIFKYEIFMISTLVLGFIVCCYSFSSARMSDPSIILEYLKVVDPAFYFSKLSNLMEYCCGECNYQSFESTTQVRKKRYNPDSLLVEESSQGGCAPNLNPNHCRCCVLSIK